jgi:hypothetical protein
VLYDSMLFAEMVISIPSFLDCRIRVQRYSAHALVVV